MIEVLGGLFIFLLVLTASAIFDGWVVSTMWGWFAVGAFNLPKITIAQAIGIELLFRYMMKASSSSEVKDEEVSVIVKKMVKGVGKNVLFSLLIFTVAYIAHLFL